MSLARLVISALVYGANGVQLRPAKQPASKRGFVMCAGAPDRKQVRYGHRQPTDGTILWASVRRLRETGNTDPVHVFHVDAELPQEQIEMIESVSGVAVHDLKNFVDDDDLLGVHGDLHAYRSFYCKVMALLHSPFDQTMMMDSDVVLFRDPAVIWDHPVMKEKGTFFFRDRKIGDGAQRCKAMEEFLDRDDVKEVLKPPKDWKKRLWKDHRDMCAGETGHEQDSSLLAVNKQHANAGPFLNMLKKLHNQYVWREKGVKGFVGWGDKELYWIACELAGVEIGWSPRGRPMHVFFGANHVSKSDKQKAQQELQRERKAQEGNLSRAGAQLTRVGTELPDDEFIEDGEEPTEQSATQGNNVSQKNNRRWLSKGPRTCIAQVQTDGDGSQLLLANMDGGCDWAVRLVNGVTVWNANNTDPGYSGNGYWGFEVWTGKGRRRLSDQELAIFHRFRHDVGSKEPDVLIEHKQKKTERLGWIAKAIDYQVAKYEPDIELK